MNERVYFGRKLPTATILSAVEGDACAIDAVLSHYERYINKKSIRPGCNSDGTVCLRVNDDVRNYIITNLINCILEFEPPVDIE